MSTANTTVRLPVGITEITDVNGVTVLVVDGPNRTVTAPSGTTLNLAAATVQQGASLGLGYLALPLMCFRKITSNDFGAIAVASGNGGTLANDTTPILQRLNGATDNKARIAWVANDVVEVQQDITYPPDLDNAFPIVANLIVYKNGNTDTGATLAIGFWEGIGDTEITGNTAAITETSAALKTVSVAAAGVGAYPKAAAITITPNAHANDAVYLLGAWLTYTRKTN